MTDELAIDLIIDRVMSADGAEFEALLEIYREAIPSGERKSADQLRLLLAKPGYKFVTGSSGGRVVGFTVLACFPSSNAALLEYMAVARDQRGQGLGRRLFKDACRRMDTSARSLLIEVDSDKREAPDRDLRTRRKQFYRSSGCREIGSLSYIMPRVATELPPKMDLLVYSKTLPATITKQELQSWLASIYVEVYGQAEDDPRIKTMTATLPGEIELI